MDLTNPNSISAFDTLRQRLAMRERWSGNEPLLISNRWSDRMLDAFRQHWPEYMMEATELALFMISACLVTVVLFHPGSPVARMVPDGILRRMIMGVAMGLTAIAIIFSPIGKRSGAHFNPSVTLTFFRLGKIKGWDATFYVAAQFIGGVTGVLLAMLMLGSLVADSSVKYAATIPGPAGVIAAFAAEVFITFILMSVVLKVSNT